MKIFYPNKESVDVDHNGKTARFSGDIGVGGFRAFASSMRWMLPVRDVPVSDLDRKKWVDDINNHFTGCMERVYFVNDDETLIKPIYDLTILTKSLHKIEQKFWAQVSRYSKM